MRDIKVWVESFAEKPGGLAALFIIAFAESSFFPIPPDVLLIALAVSLPARSFRYALVCSLGSVLGGMAGYLIGWAAWSAVHPFFFRYVFSEEVFNHVKELYEENAFMAILTAAFTPIPYKVFTIAAGVFGVPFMALVTASMVGRGARFFLVGGLIWKFGPPIKGFIDKYFDILSLLFLALLVLGFVAIKYLM